MQSIRDAFSSLMTNIVVLLVTLTIGPLLLKIFFPVVGNVVWQGYCRALAWLIAAPFRFIGLLIREVRRK